MPLYINHGTVTVIREGRRMKVKPSKQPYDFTPAEVAAAEDAGVRMEPAAKPAGPKVVDAGTAEPESPEVTSNPAVPATETAAQRKAREKAEAKTSAVEDEAL